MHPSYINSSTINQQRMTSFHYNNGNNFVAADGPVILENNCLTGNRSSKKDRHSKINTARGPRDRRMRLSLDVAKKFFNLQDMLGFDKASNTIEWLLVKSKPAIRDLLINQSCSLIMGVSNSHSPSASCSDCEVVSVIDDQILMEKTGEDNKVSVKDKEKFNSCSNNNKEKKKVKSVRKSVYIDHSLAKETREKARARARKRTTEKKNIKLGLDQNTNRFGSWIPFGESQVQLTGQAEYPNSHFQFRQGINVGDNSSINWSPSLFNYLHNSGISHEHQVISDLQILGKPWEGINN